MPAARSGSVRGLNHVVTGMLSTTCTTAGRSSRGSADSAWLSSRAVRAASERRVTAATAISAPSPSGATP